MSHLIPTKHYIKDFVKNNIHNLANEFCEAAGEPQDAVIYIDSWRKKKSLHDDIFKEYVEEIADIHYDTLDSQAFQEWVEKEKYQDAMDNANGTSFHQDDDHAEIIEYYIDEYEIELVNEFLTK